MRLSNSDFPFDRHVFDFVSPHGNFAVSQYMTPAGGVSQVRWGDGLCRASRDPGSRYEFVSCAEVPWEPLDD